MVNSSMKRTRKPASFGLQLRAFLIRNYQIKLRAKRQTLTEIIIPLYFILLLMLIRMSVPDSIKPPLLEPQTAYPLTSDSSPSINQRIAVVNLDSNGSVSNFTKVIDDLKSSPTYKVIEFPSEDAILKTYFTEKGSMPSTFDLVVVFKSWNLLDIEYTIRGRPESGLPSTADKYADEAKCRPTWSDDPQIREMNDRHSDCPVRRYYETGFTALQIFIDSSIIATVTDDGQSLANVTMSGRVFPKGAAKQNTEFLRSFVSIYMVLSFTPFVSYICILVVGEKEKKLKIVMKLMGLRETVYWIGWFLTFGVLVSILSIVISLLLVGVGILPNANIFLLFVLFVLYGFSTITFAFVLTPFFNKAKLAGGFAGLSTCIFTLFYFLSVYMSGVSASTFYFLSLLSPTAFALGLDRAVYLDLTSGGLRFDNFWQTGYCFGSSVVMLTIDVLLYGFLAFYFENIIPGEFGHKRKPWFLCLPSFWCIRVSQMSKQNNVPSNEVPGGDDFEKVPSELKGKEAIRIFNLRKVFKPLCKPKVVALDNVSLDIYEGQITAILGHNGAGKTTLLNILAGVDTSTKGTATIYGLDIEDGNIFDHIWQMIGLCPQQDVIFETLTTKHHLEFFGRIKNVPSADLQEKIHNMLVDVDLIDRIDTPAAKLSGGQKRKLSIAIALIGDPQIIILDEPTSGVDPYSRRRLWNLFQKYKSERVILLTTHFMDEADILADRKAIISNGIVKCAGSSLFLKNRFGLGYHLTMVMDGDNHDVDGVSQLVRYHVPTRKKIRSSAVELAFLLPLSEVGKFSDLMFALDEAISGSSFGIRTYGISMTTLEEVFLKLGENASTTTTWPNKNNSNDTNVVNHRDRRHSSLVIDSVRALLDVEADFNWLQAFLAVFKVHVFVTIRVIRNVLTTIIVPIILLFIYFYVLNKYGGDRSAYRGQPVELSPSFYSGTYSGLYDTSLGLNLTSFVNEVRLHGIDLVPFSRNFSELLAVSPHTFHLNFTNYTVTPSSISVNLLINYNDTQQHSLPIIINMIDNVVMNLFKSSGQATNRRPHIRVFSELLPARTATSANGFITVTIITMLIGSVYNSIAAMFAAESVEDRELKVKHQLYISGLPFNVYWPSKFAANFILFCFTLTITVIIIEIFQVTPLSEPFPIFLFIVCFLLYMMAALPYGYCLAHVFDKYETAQSVMYTIFLILGFAPYLMMTVCDAIYLDNGNVGEIMHYLFTSILPLYTPFAILYQINKAYYYSLLVPGGAEPEYLSNAMIVILISLPVQCAVYWIVLWLLDLKKAHGTWSHLCGGVRSKQEVNVFLPIVPTSLTLKREEDDDVKQERDRINQLNNLNMMPVLVMDGLRKEFVTTKSKSKTNHKNNRKSTIKVAVSNLSFGVNESEVFGLLGPNGAGKSTALKMIVAEETSTRGRVVVAGYDMSLDQTKAIRNMGYCPQHDALWKNLTLREHLECYAAVRGVTKSRVAAVVDNLMNALQISEHASKKSSTLSGGTKRKLSFAISMLGSPKVVLLDEPSTGMDPQSKRYLWDTIIASFMQGKRGAILTTHSMEEADVLCSRVGIMVRGELRCIGSTQHLKNKYGSGYILESKVISSDGGSERRLTALEKLVGDMFTGAVIHERFEDRVKYQIPKTGSLSLANIFAALEKAKEEIGVEEYSFSQTTLEQVFLDFAKEQEVEGDVVTVSLPV